MISVKETFDIKYVSPTGLDCFNRCPARFLFSKLMRLKKQDSFDGALVFGKCLHSCLHEAYESPERAFDIFEAIWTKENIEEDKKRNLSRARDMLVNFYRHHKSIAMYKPLDPPGGVIQTADKYSDYEAPFLLDVGGEYPVYGKIDRLVSWNGQVWPLDYKTSSQLTVNVCSSFEICSQTLCYSLGASVLTGELVKGMLIELIRVSDKNDEILIHPIFVRPIWFDTFIRRVITLESQIKYYNENKLWPKNPCACSSYGMFGVHAYECEFKNLCSVDDWENELRYFDRETFDPLKDVEIEKSVITTKNIGE
jgi:hypothetical protein